MDEEESKIVNIRDFRNNATTDPASRSRKVVTGNIDQIMKRSFLFNVKDKKTFSISDLFS